MAVKRYEMTPVTQAFMRRNAGRAKQGVNPFTFRLRFERVVGDSRHLLAPSRCPLIDLFPGEIVQTSNPTAQRMLEAYEAPTSAVRRGVPNPKGNMFEDVTDLTDEFAVDLDKIFDSVEV